MIDLSEFAGHAVQLLLACWVGVFVGIFAMCVFWSGARPDRCVECGGKVDDRNHSHAGPTL